MFNFFKKNNAADVPPVAIGGVGGSGTRLVAEILIQLGFYMGSDLNKSNDNIWFALLFTRPETLGLSSLEFKSYLKIYRQALRSNKKLSKKQLLKIKKLVDPSRRQKLELLQSYFDSLSKHQDHHKTFNRWGWKAPNTHIFIDKFYNAMSDMKYIHVVRNGLDMAYSENQNQLNLWGEYFFHEKLEVNPENSLKFWCKSHRRVLRLCESMENNFLFLNFDDLCLSPEKGILKILMFLECDYDDNTIKKLASLVRLPKSIGRYKEYGLDFFDNKDIEEVKKMGFDISV